MSLQIRECPQCEGKGGSYVRHLNEDWKITSWNPYVIEGSIRSEGWEICDECKGAGEIREVTLTVQIGGSIRKENLEILAKWYKKSLKDIK